MQVKIAITGPHCSGKSTLIRRIESEINFTNVKFIKFNGKDCPIKYFKKSVICNENDEIAIKLWMLSKMLSREINVKYNLEYEKSLTVFDRCLIDQIVYPVVNLRSINIDIIKQFTNLWLEKNPYEQIFYVPKNEDFLKKVPHFIQDLEYLEVVEKVYLEVLDTLKKDSQKVVILPCNQEEQKNIIIDAIKTFVKQTKIEKRQ